MESDQRPRSSPPTGARSALAASACCCSRTCSRWWSPSPPTRGPASCSRRLHDLFAPYLRNLHFTAYPVSYPFARYYLTHALPTDVDFSCEVEFRTSTARPKRCRSPIRTCNRWSASAATRRIANAAGTLADAEANEDFSSILPKAHRRLDPEAPRRHARARSDCGPTTFRRSS